MSLESLKNVSMKQATLIKQGACKGGSTPGASNTQDRGRTAEKSRAPQRELQQVVFEKVEVMKAGHGKAEIPTGPPQEGEPCTGGLQKKRLNKEGREEAAPGKFLTVKTKHKHREPGEGAKDNPERATGRLKTSTPINDSLNNDSSTTDFLEKKGLTKDRISQAIFNNDRVNNRRQQKNCLK
jgi:hypothetical protein